MSSIERTAYPRFKRHFTTKELAEIYTPTKAEIVFGYASTQGKTNFFNLIVLLKTFQRLGYFPKPSEVPIKIINHIHSCLKLPEEIAFGYDLLFTETIDWERITTHWQDLFRVVLSIKAGKISSSILLRKLGNYSRKNRLYQAFQELGRVVRTVFLLQYISDLQLRSSITAATNKVESYHGFSKWFFFGGEGVIAHHDPEEQEKIIKYNDLIANAVTFHNVVDLTEILRSLKREGYLRAS